MTMAMPADQRQLYDDLTARLDAIVDEAALIAFMAGVLHSLLRRQGDAEFLAAVQDAFTDGIAGRESAEQKLLASEVIRVVIEKRPEIARAWQALYGPRAAVPQPARRATDQLPPLPPLDGDDDPAVDPLPPLADYDEVPAVAAEPQPPYEFASSESVVADYIAEVLDRRLEIFTVPPAGFPTVTYCHDRPFFLFTPAFRTVVRRFATGPLLVRCRIGLERRVYRHAKPEVLAEAESRNAFLAEKRPEVWKIVIEYLTKLAGAQKNAEAKLAQAATAEDDGAYKIVEVPVSRPRTYRILGVGFTLGTKAATKKVKVKAKSPFELDKVEVEAMEAFADWRDIAADEGLELPAGADFQLLRTLFEFDAKRFRQAAKEFSALVGHKETTRKYLFDRLKFVDETFSNHLSDLLVVMLFYEHGDGRFGFNELYEICVGSSIDKTAQASKRPFVQSEVARRPREMAFQLREALRRGMDEDAVAQAVVLLLDVCERMAKTRFRHELDAALTVLGAFPLAFGGDPDEAAYVAIGHTLHDALTTKHPPEREQVLAQVTEAYLGVLRRRKRTGR
ncbi:MAG: hypothetical protein ACM31L_13545 [Actinomycetota bacterium]